MCYIWRSLARSAWEDKCDFYVLLGDDVNIHTQGWASEVRKSFVMLEERSIIEAKADGKEGRRSKETGGKSLPFGFGCVALYDNTFPYFPSFPVVHKIHLDAFDGAIFPPIFFNQDADPYLYELYKRWDASVFANVKLTNGIGGSGQVETRYQKKHADGWTHETLANGVKQLGEHLRFKV